MKSVKLLTVLALTAQLSLPSFAADPFAPSPAEKFMLTEPLTLEEAYRLALKRSEDLAISQQAIEAAEGRFIQAFGSSLPHVNYMITHFEQEVPRDGGSSGNDGASANLQRRTTPQQKFVFSQPIFSGFKQFAAMAASNAEKAQRLHERRIAEELLFIDVTDSFYNLAQAQEDVEIIDGIIGVLSERIDDLEKRAKLGRSRDSEVQTAFAEVKILEADREEAKLAEVIARQLLQFYVGRQITAGIAPEKGIRTDLPAASDYLLRLDSRSDVLAAKEAYIYSKNVTKVYRADLFPRVTLDGNYYTKRVGFQKDIDWDVLLSIDVPIFEGTETWGAIKSASADERAAQLNYFKVVRLAEVDVENAYATVHASRLQEDAMKKAIRASQQSVRILQDEYNKNLVNNLEVLDTLRRHRDVHRRFNAVRFKAKKDYWRLKVASGETPIYDAA